MPITALEFQYFCYCIYRQVQEKYDYCEKLSVLLGGIAAFCFKYSILHAYALEMYNSFPNEKCANHSPTSAGSTMCGDTNHENMYTVSRVEKARFTKNYPSGYPRRSSSALRIEVWLFAISM